MVLDSKELKKPGDVFYPRYQRVIFMPATEGKKYFKGVIYSVNTTGQLKPYDGNVDNAVFQDGMYQCAETLRKGAAAQAGDRVQVYGPGSRVGVYAPAGIHRGQRVGYGINTATVDAQDTKGAQVKDLTYTVNAPATNSPENIKGAIENAVYLALYRPIGRVFDIYTGGNVTDAPAKPITKANDIVIVELGMN